MKRNNGKRPFLYLLLTVALILIVLFLLEKVRRHDPGQPPEMVPPVVTEQPVQRPGTKEPPVSTVAPEAPRMPELPVQKRYSSPVVIVPAVKPPVNPVATGTVAIIIDDMGASVSEVQELMAIGIPVTFSVIPGLGRAREVAEAAHNRGYQVMLHVPMEPHGYPQQRLESNGLLVAHDDHEIKQRVASYFRLVPHAIGANNHMGSRFTEDREKMRLVLGMLQQKGLFFVDSMTTPKSSGLSVARDLGLPAAARTAPFIDNSNDVGAIKIQLRTLAKIAGKRGSAIGICHPHRATIRALQEELPLLRSSGTRFVYVSTLVR
jgi:uncharacterized protein